MMEVLMKDPSTQQMLLSRMPPHMRRPEVLQSMMANPEVRARISALAQQSGLDKVMGNFGAEHVASSINSSRQLGLDPGLLFSRFMASPNLSRKLQDPRIMAAVMQVCASGPEALKQYEGDKDVLDAYMEAAEILSQAQKEAGPASSDTACASSSSGGSEAQAGQPLGLSPEQLAAAEQQLGVPPDELMRRLMARPDLLEKFQNPRVQAALQEVASKPWKAVKYMFDREVMAALQDVKSLLKDK